MFDSNVIYIDFFFEEYIIMIIYQLVNITYAI